jgi:hypothetical protein
MAIKMKTSPTVLPRHFLVPVMITLIVSTVIAVNTHSAIASTSKPPKVWKCTADYGMNFAPPPFATVAGEGTYSPNPMGLSFCSVSKGKAEAAAKNGTFEGSGYNKGSLSCSQVDGYEPAMSNYECRPIFPSGSAPVNGIEIPANDLGKKIAIARSAGLYDVCDGSENLKRNADNASLLFDDDISGDRQYYEGYYRNAMIDAVSNRAERGWVDESGPEPKMIFNAENCYKSQISGRCMVERYALTFTQNYTRILKLEELNSEEDNTPFYTCVTPSSP